MRSNSAEDEEPGASSVLRMILRIARPQESMQKLAL